MFTNQTAQFSWSGLFINTKECNFCPCYRMKIQSVQFPYKIYCSYTLSLTRSGFNAFCKASGLKQELVKNLLTGFSNNLLGLIVALRTNALRRIKSGMIRSTSKARSTCIAIRCKAACSWTALMSSTARPTLSGGWEQCQVSIQNPLMYPSKQN